MIKPLYQSWLTILWHFFKSLKDQESKTLKKTQKLQQVQHYKFSKRHMAKDSRFFWILVHTPLPFFHRHFSQSPIMTMTCYSTGYVWLEGRDGNLRGFQPGVRTYWNVPHVRQPAPLLHQGLHRRRHRGGWVWHSRRMVVSSSYPPLPTPMKADFIVTIEQEGREKTTLFFLLELALLPLFPPVHPSQELITPRAQGGSYIFKHCGLVWWYFLIIKSRVTFDGLEFNRCFLVDNNLCL